MELLEKLLGENAVTLAIAGAATLLLPKLGGNLAPPLRDALASGIRLLVEAESEAEGAFIEQLMQQTLTAVLAALSQPGGEAERRHAAAAKIRHFERRVHRRAARFGWDEQDRRARYQRHVRRLKHAMIASAEREPQELKPSLDHIAGTIQENW